MKASLELSREAALSAALTSAVEAACARVAPAWPLDRQIAVNPWWGFVGQPIADAAAELTALSGTRLLMPREWYRAQWDAGRFAAPHLQEALRLAGSHRPLVELVAALDRAEETPPRCRLMTDLADEGRDLAHGLAWGEFVTRQLSQACAAAFDTGQAGWAPPSHRDGLYAVWREQAARDAAPRLLMGVRGLRDEVAALPEDAQGLIALATGELDVPDPAREGYFTALLLSINGWASACAFRRWDARLAGRDDDAIVQLLACRLAWEVLLQRCAGGPVLTARWREELAGWAAVGPAVREAQREDWIFQRALELAWQETAVTALAAARPAAAAGAVPAVQAVFCIDVRSEVFRRALEHSLPEAQTLGFAGFFGLPVSYTPVAGPARPQLPGLLAPTLQVTDAGADTLAGTLRREAGLGSAWRALAGTPASAFSFVESVGTAWAWALLRDSFSLGRPAGDVLRRPARRAGLRPALTAAAGGAPLDLQARVALAAGILRGMSLTDGFARLLVLVGHGAGTVNNPQAAGLHCGACGGQTGELNARVLAALLNDPAVRDGLRPEGIRIPGDTHVVAGLHNTTTDEVELFDLDQVPASHAKDVCRLRTALAAAGWAARGERAEALGITGKERAEVDAAVRARSTDWSEVRPEWGLAGNAAFIAAPRERTRALDLGGRAFLHEYRWDRDQDGAVLEQIMTAPMVVAHWINMQYYASTVDNLRWGSGDKVLHNVVGGRLGVFEGATGDLRIGLALQSLHDGRDWVHDPLRLSVFLEAPAAAVDRVLARHAVVGALVRNEWLYLFRIDPADGGVWHRRGDGWHRADASPQPTGRVAVHACSGAG